MAQVLSCELCEIAKNIFSYRTSPVAASAYIVNYRWTKQNQIVSSFSYFKNINILGYFKSMCS